MSAAGPLTADELVEIEARRAAASPGPWRPGRYEKHHVYIPYADGLEGPGGERVVLRMNPHFPYEADATFVGHAWEDIGRLLATVRARNEEIARLREGGDALAKRLEEGIAMVAMLAGHLERRSRAMRDARDMLRQICDSPEASTSRSLRRLAKAGLAALAKGGAR